LRDPAGAIADTFTFGHITHGDQGTGQRHHRAQSKFLRTQFGERRGAIKHDAGTNPGHMCLRQRQHRGRVGQRAVIELQGQQFAVALQLQLGQGMTALIGAGEVADQVEFANLCLAPEPRMAFAQAVQGEAQPVHARIQLQPHIQRPRPIGRQQPIGLTLILDGNIQPKLGGAQILSRLETTFQQQDAGIGRTEANLFRFFQAGHGIAVGNLA